MKQVNGLRPTEGNQGGTVSCLSYFKHSTQ